MPKLSPVQRSGFVRTIRQCEGSMEKRRAYLWARVTAFAIAATKRQHEQATSMTIHPQPGQPAAEGAFDCGIGCEDGQRGLLLGSSIRARPVPAQTDNAART